MRKYQLILISALLSICISAKGQFHFQKSQNAIPYLTQEILKRSKPILAYQRLDIAKEKLMDSILYLSFLDINNIPIIKRKIEYRSLKNFSWFGKSSDGHNELIISVLGDDIQATFTSDFAVYRLQTLNGIYVISRLNQSLYAPELCGSNKYDSETHKHRPKVEPIIKKDNIKLNEGQTSKRTSYPLQTPENYKCKIRILVMYTRQSTNNGLINVVNTARLATDQCNQAFYNSGINYELELVHVQSTEYEEEGLLDDLHAFLTQGDGILDEVHDLRIKHSADLCILLVNENEACGIAASIKPCADEAFCEVNVDCATGSFSFAHEIGHLFGCRHDVFHDDKNIPYVYGHGYLYQNDYNTNLSYRTIMSYDCPTGCPRILHFSNPDTFKNGFPTGSNLFCKNFRVINENAQHVMSFRPAGYTRTVFQAPDMEPDADVIYNNVKIQTSGSVTVASNQSYYFLSGTEIEFNPGFEANLGNTLVAEIKVLNCGAPYTDSCGYDPSTDEKIEPKNNESIVSNITALYPNPTTGIFTFDFENNLMQGKTCYIYNYLGQCLFLKNNFSKENNIIFDISNQPAGLYFLIVKDEKTVMLTKQIIKQ